MGKQAREPRPQVELEILHEVKAMRCEVAVMQERIAALHAKLDQLASVAPQEVIDSITKINTDVSYLEASLRGAVEAYSPKKKEEGG